MEDWQRNHILHNLTKLVQTTNCNVSLLTTLLSQKILSDEDLQVIQSKRTNVDRCNHLFNILPQRKESYKALILALQSTCQSGAVNILVTGFILHGSIRFQGHVSLISELLPNLDENVTRELNIHFLRNFTDDVVVKNTIPCKLDYYIPRTIVSRRRLDKILFQESFLDVWLFQGLEWNELSVLANGLPTDVSSDLLHSSEQLNTRHVLLESLDHFDNITTKTSNPVHLIEHTNGIYHWIKSHGSVQNILKFVNKTPALIKEEMFIEQVLNDNISVCLTDSPGLGKTVLLANLTRAIVDRYPLRLVIFIHLREFIPVLQAKLNTGAKLNSQLIRMILSKCTSDHPVGRRIVLYKLANDPSHLLFDGFDEVLPEQQELAKAMIKIIANSFPKCQIFVTARLHMRQELEQIVGTLGFHIAPFNTDNQIEFLTKFWKSCGAESESLVDYAKTCLTTVAAQINDSEQEIAGIPLQCYMIGEVFLAKAKCYNSGSFLGTEVPVRSMAQLYNELINKKLDTVKDFGIRESLIQAHIYSAMALLFPEEVSNFVKCPKNISHEQLCRVGIMEHDGDTKSVWKIRFVHRTFAEFFVGLFASSLLQNAANNSLQFVMKKILATYQRNEYLIDNPLGREYLGIVKTSVYQYPVIAYFLIFQLREQKTEPRYLQIKLNEEELPLSVLAAVSFDSFELLDFYVSLFDKSDTFSGCKLSWSLMQLVAAKHASLAILERIFELSNILELDEKCKINKSAILNVASYSGNYKIVEYLIRAKHIRLDAVPFALHFCLSYSNLQSEAVIKRKIQIIKYLSQQPSSSILLTSEIELSPILGKCIHLDLLKCALQNGARIQDTDFDGKSALHLTPKYTTSEAYHDFVLFLSKSFDKAILSQRDVFECTPLHYAVQYLPISADTLKLFLSYEADINAKDKNGNSVLFYALGRQTEETLELLTQNGAMLDDKNLRQETALHIACKFANTSAVKWLIGKGANELAQDSEGIIPTRAQLTMQEFRNTNVITSLRVVNDTLITNYKEINRQTSQDKNSKFSGQNNTNYSNTKRLPSLDEEKTIDASKFRKTNSSLHIEFCQKTVDIEKIKLQFSLNADFNGRNADGDTPLHLGVINAEISKEVLDFAVKVGGSDLNLVNDSNLSVLAQAIYAKRSISFLKLLVEYGADVCRLNNLEAAIRNNDFNCVKFLLENGADIIKVSREGQEGDNPIALAFHLRGEAHFEVVKFLIASTPTLNFDDPRCVTEIVDHAVRAYEASDKFQTVELFNLMASHGLNYALCDAVNQPALFSVMKGLGQTDQKAFVMHLNSLSLKQLFHIQDATGNNLLCDCAMKFEMDKEFISMFHANGVDFNLKNKQGQSVLLLAIEKNYSKENLVALTLSGADPYVLDENGKNLLYPAIKNQSRAAVDFLLKTGVSLHSKNPLTPFIRACNWYITNVINLEFFEFIVNLAELGKLNWNEVHDVCCGLRLFYTLKYDKKCAEVLKLFKTHDLNLTAGTEGTPVFFSVIQNLDLEQIEKFVKYCAQAGYNNLGELKTSGSINLIQYFLTNTKNDFPVQILHLLGDVKKILNSGDDNGWPVLAYAIEHSRSLEYMKQLIEFGADVNHLNNVRLSLLHYAARKGDLNCVDFFVDQVQDKNCVNDEGYSPLHWAFLKHTQNYNIAKLLIRKGVSVNLKSFSGVKIIDLALDAYERWAIFKSADVFILMLSHGLDVKSKYSCGVPIMFNMINVLSAEHSEDILKYLYQNNKSECFHLRGNDGETLLQRCRQKFEPSQELLKIFKLVGVH